MTNRGQTLQPCSQPDAPHPSEDINVCNKSLHTLLQHSCKSACASLKAWCWLCKDLNSESGFKHDDCDSMQVEGWELVWTTAYSLVHTPWYILLDYVISYITKEGKPRMIHPFPPGYRWESEVAFNILVYMLLNNKPEIHVKWTHCSTACTSAHWQPCDTLWYFRAGLCQCMVQQHHHADTALNLALNSIREPGSGRSGRSASSQSDKDSVTLPCC